jgi:hypothetical protein
VQNPQPSLLSIEQSAYNWFYTFLIISYLIWNEYLLNHHCFTIFSHKVAFNTSIKPFKDLHHLANACMKTTLDVHFIYLGNKEIYRIFKAWYIISVSFSTKCNLFYNFIFFCSNNTNFFINHALKLKYTPQWDKG